MKSFSQICEILVTVVLMFFVPVSFFMCEQECLMTNYAQYQVIYFVDSIRNIGYLNQSMYEVFLENLSRTNSVYQVEITVYKRYQTSGDENSYLLGTYTDDILDIVYKEDRYTMHQGDFISVRIKRLSDTKIQKIMSILGVMNVSKSSLPIQYGGMIRDECF